MIFNSRRDLKDSNCASFCLYKTHLLSNLGHITADGRIVDKKSLSLNRLHGEVASFRNGMGCHVVSATDRSITTVAEAGQHKI